MEFVSIDELVPRNHLLRKIEKVIDFSFIRERVKGLYCPNNGRPAIDPVILFKMLFIGYLYGIRSERQLVRDIQVNVAYRWFLRLDLKDKVPDASTLSQNRRRRFNGSSIYQEIFDVIVLRAIRKKMVDGKVLYTDSTHLKASANRNKFKKRHVAKSTKSYLKALDEAVTEDRTKHGKKPLKPEPEKPEVKESRVSTTDPDSGYMVRKGKPEGFFYLDHRTTDGRCNIITDVHITPATVHDSIPYLDRLDRQRERFGFDVESVGLDAGYFTAPICKGLEDRGIFGAIAYRRPNHPKGYLHKSEFVYDQANDCYHCPGLSVLRYRTTSRQGYRQYKSNKKHCKACHLRPRCTTSANRTKLITRHVWQDSVERADANRLSERGKQIYKRRKETVERSFADAKQLHGYRYARMRGLSKVREQGLLCAAVQNMKKIALALCKKGESGPGGRLFWPKCALRGLLQAIRTPFCPITAQNPA